ncbi:MAG: hypothetical protein BA865_16345 [Desulfobacterales bacterium S5133MH4]|nr:MAG: hypothetical protein BA865_16345 [Desulfobacterales bacterium S5133MH4]
MHDFKLIIQGGVSMARKILPNYFVRLSAFLFFLLALISLAISPVHADSGSNTDQILATDNTDGTIEMIRAHVQEVGANDPETLKKLTQLEEKLGTGMSCKGSCLHCHGGKGGKR